MEYNRLPAEVVVMGNTMRRYILCQHIETRRDSAYEEVQNLFAAFTLATDDRERTVRGDEFLYALATYEEICTELQNALCS